MTTKNRLWCRASWVLAALLAGCALPTAPDDAPAMAAPEAWATLQAAPPAGQWSAPTDAALEQLQQRALAANRDIAQALLHWQAAQRQEQMAGLARQPTPSLSATAGATRSLDGEFPLQRSASLDLGASYEVDLWQRLAHVQGAAAAQARAAQADWVAARVLVRTRVAEAWWTLAVTAAQAPGLALQIESADQAVALTRLRVQEGKLLPIEIDKAAATLHGLRLQAAQLAEQNTRQRLQLGLLLADPAFVPPDAPALPAALPADWRASERPDQVLSRRPDVQQARASLDAALQRLRRAEAARYPQLRFDLGAGTGGSHWSEWLEHPLARLSSTLLVPMIDWRRIELQRLDALGEHELVGLALRDTMHRALVEIEQLAAEQTRLQAEEAAQARRLAEARTGERLAELRLAAGAVSKLDWLQARNARLAAEHDTLQLSLRRLLNAVALQRALVVG